MNIDSIGGQGRDSASDEISQGSGGGGRRKSQACRSNSYEYFWEAVRLMCGNNDERRSMTHPELLEQDTSYTAPLCRVLSEILALFIFRLPLED